MPLFFGLLLIQCCAGVLMIERFASALMSTLSNAGMLPDSPTTPEEVAAYRALNLIDVPNCPLTTQAYSCDEEGKLAWVNVTFSPLSPGLHRDWGSPITRSLTMRNFYGYAAYRFFALDDTLEVIDSVVGNFGNDGDRFLFSARNLLSLRNVTCPNYNMSRFTVVQPVFTSCSFTDVLFPCPVPQWLWRCWNTTTPPPCLSSHTYGTLGTRDLSYCDETKSACSVTCENAGRACTPPNSRDTFFETGISRIFFHLPQLGTADSIGFQTRGTQGILRRVEVFDVAENGTWRVIFARPSPRRFPLTSFVTVTMPRLTISAFRLELEQWFPDDAIRQWSLHRPYWPEAVFKSPPLFICLDSIQSMSSRSMLDESLADSLCVGRVCLPLCEMFVPEQDTLVFERTVKAQFLVIEGGDPWIGGQLVASTSDNTRVYKLDGRETKEVNVTGVGDFKRVRLVGDPVGVSLPPPTLPNRLGLPGVFVKTYRSTVPTGGVTLSVGDGGGLVAPNGTVVSVARVQNQTFAATDDGAIWQVNGTVWTALTGFASLNLNVNEKAPARRLVVVGDRLVVVVAANTKVHDGSRDQLLVNRVVTQTPIDALDVQTGVWYNRLLEHGITKNVSDVDVVRWNATAFAVVDRATREAAVFEWRPFPFALVKCSANTDCRACTTSEANEEPCRWCGTRCVSRLTFCLPTESSACVDPTTTTTTLTANVSLTTSATSTTEIGTTTTTSFVSTSLASLATSADSGADSSDPLLPLYIVLGVLGALVLAAGLAIAVIKVRDLKSRPAPKAVPMEEPPKAAAVAEKPKPAEFDADARYTQFEPDAEDPRYTSL
jgi:hypothetical protein